MPPLYILQHGADYRSKRGRLKKPGKNSGDRAINDVGQTNNVESNQWSAISVSFEAGVGQVELGEKILNTPAAL